MPDLPHRSKGNIQGIPVVSVGFGGEVGLWKCDTGQECYSMFVYRYHSGVFCDSSLRLGGKAITGTGSLTGSWHPRFDQYDV